MQLMAFADDIEETTNRVVQDAKAMAAVTEDPELRYAVLTSSYMLYFVDILTIRLTIILVVQE